MNRGGMGRRNAFPMTAVAVAVALAAIVGSTVAACAAHVETAATGASGVGGAAATGSGGARATGGGGGATVDGGPPCLGPSECDSTSYCQADDQDCGPGHCRKRPHPGGDPSADFYCGCDGVVYGTPDKARAMGVDVGNNTRCAVDPADFFPCGSRSMCRGSGKCCGSDGAACDFQHYCELYNGQAEPDVSCGKALVAPTGYDHILWMRSQVPAGRVVQ